MYSKQWLCNHTNFNLVFTRSSYQSHVDSSTSSPDLDRSSESGPYLTGPLSSSASKKYSAGHQPIDQRIWHLASLVDGVTIFPSCSSGKQAAVRADLGPLTANGHNGSLSNSRPTHTSQQIFQEPTAGVLPD